MPYLFSFNGGAGKCSPTVNEKFFLFCLMNDKEWFVNQLVRAGHVEHIPAYPVDRLGALDSLPGSHSRYPELVQSFMTDSFRYVKLFFQMAGFGIRKQTYALFMELIPENTVHPITTVLPLSIDNVVGAVPSAREGGDPNYNWLFRGKVKILAPEEVLTIWPDETTRFVRSMSPMPLTLKKRLIITSSEEMHTQVRRIRIAKKNILTDSPRKGTPLKRR